MASYYGVSLEKYMTLVFGKTIGTHLLQIAEKKQKIAFASLGPQEQYAFIKDMMTKLYGPFYSQIKTFDALGFLLGQKVADNISTALESKYDRGVQLKEVTITSKIAHDSPEPDKDESIWEISGDAAGFIMLKYPEQSIRNIEATVTKSDDAIKEFSQVCFNETKKELASIAKKSVEIHESDKQTVVDWYENQEAVIMFSFSVRYMLDLDTCEFSGNIYAACEEKSVVAEAKKNKLRAEALIFEQTPPQIICTYKEDIKGNLQDFVEKLFPNKAESVITSVCEEHSIDLTSAENRPVFISNLIRKHCAGFSENKKKCIRVNLQTIFGVH